jgi:hypothetical protein
MKGEENTPIKVFSNHEIVELGFYVFNWQSLT